MSVYDGNADTVRVGPGKAEYTRDELGNPPVINKDLEARTGQKKPLKSSLVRKARKKLSQQQAAVILGDWPPGSNKKDKSALDSSGKAVDANDETAVIKTEEPEPTVETKVAQDPPAKEEKPKKTAFKPNNSDVGGLKASHRAYLFSVNPEVRELMANGIMAPLTKTQNGILFPYTPTIMWTYAANYGTYDMTHGAYQQNYFQNTPSPMVQVTAQFTAQTTSEAEYTLAALHFLKWSTKGDFGAYVNEGKDRNATAGSPPPILRFSAYGHAGAKNLPVIIRNVSYTYPEDIDYVTVGQSGKGKVINGIYYSYNEIQEMNHSATEFNEGEYGAVRYPEYKEEATIPTQLLVTLDMAIQIPPSRVRNEFNVKEYALGKTMTNKGFI